MKNLPVARTISPGMGQAVAERTILRRKEDGTLEDWADVASRVAVGNALLAPGSVGLAEAHAELLGLERHIANGNLLMSGRHLQHGDVHQSHRNMEVFTNCSTAAASFLSFYLLLNGSGVGRCFDDDMMLIDWDKAPSVCCVMAESHADFDPAVHMSVRDAEYVFVASDVIWHCVEDSREGWAKAFETWELMAFEGTHTDKVLILDFTDVRCKGSPIGGMQNRPASGPVPLMTAFANAMAHVVGKEMDRWEQAMHVDHYFAECVLVGGARRAARMSTKTWRDLSVLRFIEVKRPVEFRGKTAAEVAELRRSGAYFPSFLWSSNNSVTVDAEFWHYVRNPDAIGPLAAHARAVFELLCTCAYGDGTGEPGIINSDKLTQNDAGWGDLHAGDFVGSLKYEVNTEAYAMLGELAVVAQQKQHHTIVNPCGEIPLSVLGGFCVIADVVPFHCDTLEEAEDAFRVATRALMRVNLMNSIYGGEVRRTNRIGVGITGIHEFAWKFFGFGFEDLIDEEVSIDFWLTLRKFNRAVRDESIKYAKELGVEVPHTCTTIKPAGTTSKLFLLTEGWHLPSMREFLRWVQFRNDDPLIQDYAAAGYPTRVLTSYTGTTIVGFPTAPTITTLGMGDKLVTAAEASPEDQFQWLRLGEKYWIEGEEPEQYGGQISYTLKYLPEVTSYERFREMLLEHQSGVRCCSVMPQADTSAYEYQPEQAITTAEFQALVAEIAHIAEDVSREHVDCAGGACPIDFGGKA